LIGRGWDDAGWTDPPDRAALDAAVADRPVLLHRKDFHSLWVNGAALGRCDIGRDTPDPAGGRVVRDPSGMPTGLLLEHAARLCAPLLSAPPPDDGERVRAAAARLHAYGITAVHDFEGPAALGLLHGLSTAGPPPLRVLMHLAHAGLDSALALGLASG